MRKKILAILLITTAGWSCKTGPASSNEAVPTMSGTINSWNGTDYQDILHAGVGKGSSLVELDSVQVNAGGQFTVKYPFPIPPDGMLMSYTVSSDSTQYAGSFDNILISNPNARFNSIYMFLYMNRTHMALQLSHINRYLTSDSASAVGDYLVDYYYSNQPTMISGSYRRTFYIRSFSDYSRYRSFVTHFNLQLERGWNRVVTRIDTIQDSTITYGVSGTSCPDTCWFLTWYQSENFKSCKELL